MNKLNRHHHRKVSRDKEDTPGNTSKSSAGGEAGVTSPQPKTDQERADIEEGSRLHFGETTLQTPEEHEQDKNTDQSATDKTEPTRV
jgi:hypothetical protein